MGTYRLGLDLGTNSIGWAALQLGSGGTPEKILASGVRIFTDGRDPKSLGSLKADRRLHRQARRMRDRFKQRQNFLISELIKCGLMPEDEIERKALVTLDPYAIRADALDRELPPFHVGRGLFHLNQRRGFKSNRKTADSESGVVSASTRELQENLSTSGARTFGEFLARRHENNDPVRARRRGKKSTDLYDFYPNRQMLEDEFDQIWSAQAQFNPSLYSTETGDRLRHVIFFQRKLKPQEVGRCTLIETEFRAPRALPAFQRFRIYQEVNNLQWIDNAGRGTPVISHREARNQIVTALEAKQKLTFKQIAAILSKLGLAKPDVTFNLQSDLRGHLDGNLTSYKLAHKKLFGPAWHALSHEEQDTIVTRLLDDTLEDTEVISFLTETHGLDEEAASGVLKARLPDGHGQLSAEAIKRILPPMIDQGLLYYDAVTEAGFDSHSLFGWKDELLNELPYYGQVVRGHVMGVGTGESDEKKFGTISNPSVHITLNQLRRVFNDLVRRFGKPAEVSLEVARDLPLGAKGKRDLEKFHKENQDRNNEARKLIEKAGQLDNRANRQRVLLWKELSSDPTLRRCPFSGAQISSADLFTDKFEVEHLLPFSRTLDDSLGNKTLALRQANRDKGNKTPFEAFGSSPDGYDWEAIVERTAEMPFRKQWRFRPDAMKRFEQDTDFLARQLNDTRYISRLAGEYLQCAVPENKIWVVTGRLTALLRGFWGLNSVLAGHNQEEAGSIERKSRDDHRHHAIDAIVIGMTDRSMLGRVSREARRSEDLDLKRLFPEGIDPWDNFRDEVKSSVGKIIVAHRRRRKSQGQLHNDTAYGLVEEPDSDGVSLVVHRVGVDTLKSHKAIQAIRDPQIREQLTSVTSGLGEAAEIAAKVVEWCEARGIRRLRVCERLSVIGIRDQGGKPYKFYKGDSNAYYEIYENPGTGKWQGEIVSTFDANQKDFVPQWRQEFPTAKLIMRLRSQDLVEISINGQTQIMRVQKISSGMIALAYHIDANVDARNRDQEDEFKFTYKGPSSLQSATARFVHISASGLTSRS